MPEKGSGIRKIGYYLFQPANPTTKIQGLEARGSIEDDLVEGASGGSVWILHYFQVDRGFLWVFEVHLGFLHINTVEIRPQGRTGCENLPTGLTHMSQCNYVPVSSPCISEAGNKTGFWEAANCLAPTCLHKIKPGGGLQKPSAQEDRANIRHTSVMIHVSISFGLTWSRVVGILQNCTSVFQYKYSIVPDIPHPRSCIL